MSSKNAELARAVFQEINASSAKHEAATKKLIDELTEATDNGKTVFSPSPNDDGGINLGRRYDSFDVGEKDGKILLSYWTSSKELPAQDRPVALERITYHRARDEWVGPVDAEITPTPGERLPRVPAVVVVAEAIAARLGKK